MWHAHNLYPEFLYRNGEKVYLDNKLFKERIKAANESTCIDK
jgi:hypothetical protein